MSFDPTVDRREEILERLLDIGAGLSGIASAFRNHGPSETGELGVPRPAFLLYDGPARNTMDPRPLKRPAMPPTIWRMSPRIILLLENRDTVAGETLDTKPAPIGQEISMWMNLINNAVTNDAQLIDLVTANGAIVLSEIDNDLRPGATVGAYGAWLAMLYEFDYPFYPPR
jgi:hypothetical protein